MYPFLFENGDFFSGLAFQKCIFLKSLSGVKIFENAGFSFTCGWTKTQVFEYDDVIRHLPKHYACSVRDAILFPSPAKNVCACSTKNDT